LAPTETIQSSLTFTSTATQTPSLPTATLDVHSIVTRTPQPPAQCPGEDPNVVPQFKDLIVKNINHYDIASMVLVYLNEGGTYPPLIEPVYYEKWGEEVSLVIDVTQLDITNDGIPEIILGDPTSFNIFICRNGKYESEIHLTGDEAYSLLESQDMNLDGLPDLLITYDECEWCFRRNYRILSWNGSAFVDQITLPNYESFYRGISINNDEFGYILVYGSPVPEYSLQDIDENGTIELTTVSNSYPLGFYPDKAKETHSSRKETVTFTWNGSSYTYYGWISDNPRFRFQAVQDADAYSIIGNYDLAMKSYQTAIFNSGLKFWSPEMYQYHQDWQTWWFSLRSQREPIEPNRDLTEYPNLSAYSRFKIMLLLVIQGQLSDAGTVYTTLNSKFPGGTEGSIYTDLAQIFWGEYQESKDIKSACSKVIQKVEGNEITYLSYLGTILGEEWSLLRDTHGFWSLYYTPEYVCPFK
jgi:hypothetical protein